MSVRQLVDAIADAIATEALPVTVASGTVKTVTAGASVDGIAQVVVTVGADDILSAYSSTLAGQLSVGDFVRVEFRDGSPFIAHKVVGLPNY